MVKFEDIKDELIEVYDTLDNEFCCGLPVYLDENYIVIASVDFRGLYDGLALFRVDNIVQIIKDTKYCEKILKLVKTKNTEFAHYSNDGTDCIIDLLTKSKQNKKLVSIELQLSNQVDIRGIVLDINESNCEVQIIDDYGKSDGICYCRLEDITSIYFDDHKCQDIELLLKVTE